MRFLVVEEDPKVRALLRHHMSCAWAEVEISAHPPLQRGPLPPEFLAQGHDAVLLSSDANDGQGLTWLRDFTERNGFAPVIYLLDEDDEQQRIQAMQAGAFGVVSKHRMDHGGFIRMLEGASRQHRRSLADWRISPQADESRRFGEARIPGYRRARLLARGSVSHVYVAESEKAGNLVVLKVTPSRRDDSGVDQAFARFLQEYEIAQRVHHPNIVRLYELGVADDHAYLAMEYFQHGDLRRRMRAGVSPSEALGFASQVARALCSLHAAGILHRDLKPGNVMLRADDQIALIDFGMAKHEALDLEITDTGLIFGTPHYMSPEQGHGEDTDLRSDLYSLGVMLFEMLSGQKPYNAANPMAIIYMHRNAPLPSLPENLADLQPLIDRMMAKAPEQRFADALETARQIESARAAWLTRAELV
jgi:eukaryotic-like serine/threonine-protein kinase